MQVTVGPVTYEIVHEPLEDDDIGQINYRKAVITVDDRDMPGQVKKHVMCHEIAHAMLRSVTNNEVAAEAFGGLLLLFLQNQGNREVIKYLQKK